MSTIIFSHIPKTAGTSFVTSLYECYQQKLILDYRNAKSYKIKDKILPCNPEITSPDFSKYCEGKIIYGHFPFKRYSFLRTNYFTGAFFRDPLDRICSHYYEFLKAHKKDQTPNGLNLTSIYNFIMTYPNNFYRNTMSDRSVESLDFVGITERYDESVALYEKIFHVKLGRPYQERVGVGMNYKKELKKVGVFEECVKKIENDQRIYESALLKFERLLWIHRI